MVIGIGLVGVLLLWIGFSIYPNWLWFENLGTCFLDHAA